MTGLYRSAVRQAHTIVAVHAGGLALTNPGLVQLVEYIVLIGEDGFCNSNQIGESKKMIKYVAVES